MEVDRVAGCSADVDGLQLGDVGVVRMEPAALQQPSYFAGVARGLQVAGRQERRDAPPAAACGEDAGAIGEVGGAAEALQGQPPFPDAARLGIDLLGAVLGGAARGG